MPYKTNLQKAASNTNQASKGEEVFGNSGLKGELDNCHPYEVNGSFIKSLQKLLV